MRKIRLPFALLALCALERPCTSIPISFSMCKRRRTSEKHSHWSHFSHIAIHGKYTVAINILKYLRTRPWSTLLFRLYSGKSFPCARNLSWSLKKCFMNGFASCQIRYVRVRYLHIRLATYWKKSKTCTLGGASLKERETYLKHYELGRSEFDK